jgi:hypothetical protein
VAVIGYSAFALFFGLINGFRFTDVLSQDLVAVDLL